MRKILFSVLMGASLGFPITFEYPYIYKDPRVMGMGGAYTAVGGTSASLFYNPAGLSNIKREAGFEVDLIGATVAVGKDSYDFIQDLNDALDTGDLDNDGDTTDDQINAVLDVIAQYRGKVLHLSVDSFPSVAKNFGKVSMALGGIAVFRSNAIPHQGFGTQGVLSVDSSLTYGGVGGLSFDVMKRTLSLGVGIKALNRTTVNKDFTAREIVENENNLENYIQDEVKREGNAVGFDVGLIYRPGKVGGFDLSFGASYLNIGGLDFKDAGEIPDTLNLGVALSRSRDSKFFNAFTFALDVADVTQNYEQDKDWGKRLRLGAQLNIWSGKWSDLIVRAGSYQGYWTAGVELRFALIRIVATSYAEEVGAYSGQDENRRYMLSAYITW